MLVKKINYRQNWNYRQNRNSDYGVSIDCFNVLYKLQQYFQFPNRSLHNSILKSKVRCISAVSLTIDMFDSKDGFPVNIYKT